MSQSSLPQHRRHSRSFRENRFVYPVLSRRSKGISIGLNLNPDKICNFDCIYCQVDRRSEAVTRFVETEQMLAELDDMLSLVTTGNLFEDQDFASVPPELRRLNDIAFSGDGEPTTYRNFDEIVHQVAELKRRHGLSEARLVLITNASMFHRPAVRRGLEILDQNQGEIWAKLEAGREGYFQLVDRTKIPFRQVLDNITQAARVRPVVIQSLFMRVQGEPPGLTELEAYYDRLNEITAAGGRIRLVQLYTVARQPAESYVSPLSAGELQAIGERLAERTGLEFEVYPGAATL